MTTYEILKRTPATGWRSIYRGFSAEQAHDFLHEMGRGGYDRSADPGYYDPSTMTATHTDRGDLIEYRADPEQ